MILVFHVSSWFRKHFSCCTERFELGGFCSHFLSSTLANIGGGSLLEFQLTEFGTWLLSDNLLLELGAEISAFLLAELKDESSQVFCWWTPEFGVFQIFCWLNLSFGVLQIYPDILLAKPWWILRFFCRMNLGRKLSNFLLPLSVNAYSSVS